MLSASKKISLFFHEDTHKKKPKDIYITLSNSYSEGDNKGKRGVFM